MIPKKIHFCWVSKGELPTIIKTCRDSWYKYLPDYEFIHWDEERCKSLNSKWINEALSVKKFAFIADYVRLYAIYTEGGIYLDCDVKLLNNFNNFLYLKSFVGFAYVNIIDPVVIGSEIGTNWISEVLQFYENNSFIELYKKNAVPTIALILNQYLEKKYKLQLIDNNKILKLENIMIYPFDYFYAYNPYLSKEIITQNTISIHISQFSWKSKTFKEFILNKFHILLYLLFNKKVHDKVINIIRQKKTTNYF